VTRRRSAYRSIASLQRDNRVCRACAEAGYPLESLPVVQPYAGQRAYIHGQAPGVLEGEQRLPWRGRAGRTLRRWLELDEETFYATFYCASVTRCYPGKSPSGKGDRTPASREQQLCSLWREWELRLIRPQLILVVGGLSAKRLLGVSDLTACIGRRFELEGAVAIPLPHPSGTSRWLNEPANRGRLADGLAAVKEELSRLPPPGRLS
jgi:uracil-DNA glycosylase